MLTCPDKTPCWAEDRERETQPQITSGQVAVLGLLYRYVGDAIEM
jgi:hypothetical protein